MKILFLVDIHNQPKHLESIVPIAQQAELVLIGGDITHFGSLEDAEELLKPLRAAQPHLFAVTGNCDPAPVDEWLESEELNLDGQSRSFGEFSLVGLGGSLPCPGTTPHEHTEEEMAVLLEKAFQQKESQHTILVSHQPPFKCAVDKSSGAGHVGSRSVREAIQKEKPLLCLSGHIHESAGVDTLKETTLVNPGPFLVGNYAEIEVSPGRKPVVRLQSLV